MSNPLVRNTRSALFAGALILALASITSCGGEIPLPEPAPNRARREHDDWIKPGRMVRLRVGVGLEPERMRVRNIETFSLTLLDDIWLRLFAPNAKVRPDGPYIGDGRYGWYVYLRCPAARFIPAGGEILISYDACSATTYEPGPGNRVTGFRLTAREGYYETAIEGGGEIARTR